MPRDQYTQDEKRDMLEVYITQGNVRRAAAEYGQRYPHRRPPSHMAFHRVYRRFQGTRSIVQPLITHGSGVVSVHSTSNWTFCYIPMKIQRPHYGRLVRSWEYRRKPYDGFVLHTTCIHIGHTLCMVMHRGDQKERLGFLAVIDCLLTDVPDLLENILWTDESRFTNNGMYNRWNFRHWAETNPRLTFTSHHQVSYSVNVWCGILNSRIIGP